MKIHNYLDVTLEDTVIHEGKGMCRHATVFSGSEIEAPVQFINYTVIPPEASFGLHRHQKNNEFYVILSGEGVYQEDGTETAVKKGDIIMNAPFGTHGIMNTGEADMEVLVFEVMIAD